MSNVRHHARLSHAPRSHTPRSRACRVTAVIALLAALGGCHGPDDRPSRSWSPPTAQSPSAEMPAVDTMEPAASLPDSVPSTPETAPVADALPGTALETPGGAFGVRYAIVGGSIPLNEPFAIDIMLTEGGGPAEGVTLAVDGRMPHHRHGMNRVPIVTSLGAGVWRVENMLFHMPGRWELYFDVTRSGRTERAQDVVFLE